MGIGGKMKRKKFRNTAKGENTVIGAGTVINGPIVSDSMIMRIDGTVNGNVSTKGELIVGTNGIIKGGVEASSIELAGKINGNTTVKNRIAIEAKGELIGDVVTEILSIDETAILQGHVTMLKESTDATSDNVDKVETKVTETESIKEEAASTEVASNDEAKADE